jgi:hypothetical protein
MPGLLHLAACAGEDPELFWPVGQGAEALDAVDHVVQTYCRVCPVLVECGQRADEIEATDGVWGGARRSPGSVRPDIDYCGTMTGYYRHRRRRQPLCEPCQAAYDARLAANNARRRRKRQQLQDVVEERVSA